MSKFTDKLNEYKIVLGFVLVLIAILFVWDKTYVRAETEIKNNAELQQSIQLQQQTISQMNTKLSIDIAKLKFENRQEQYNAFILAHGDDMAVMSEVNKVKYLDIKNKFEAAEKEYELSLE